MLINAVKELYSRWSGDSQKLHAIIDALQNENDELKIRVEKLEARVGN